MSYLKLIVIIMLPGVPFLAHNATSCSGGGEGGGGKQAKD